MSIPLLTISNNHSPACGDPPIARNSEACYIGYFENVHGEQWIFTFDRLTGDAYLVGGDIGWNTRQEVRNGTVPGLQMTKDEAAWLLACWNSAVGRIA